MDSSEGRMAVTAMVVVSGLGRSSEDGLRKKMVQGIGLLIE